MKDYFNWIGCKSSIKEKYIQLCVVILNTTFDVNHIEGKGTFNCFCVVVIMFLDVNHPKTKATFNYSC